jgi:hypothetical protein
METGTMKRIALVPLTILLSAVALYGGAERLAAQEPTQELAVLEDTTVVQQVELRDGTRFTGRVVNIEGEWVTFLTLEGVELRFHRADVASVREMSRAQARAGMWPRDGSDSRLFVSPTARVPDHGHGYVGVYELIFPSVGVGLGGVGMVSGGVSIVPGIALDEQVFYLSGKARFVNVEYVQAAVGVFWVHAGSTDESAGAVFGTVTAGSDIASFTGSLGFPFATASGFEEKPLVSLGGEFRVSRLVKFITENWVVPGEDGAILAFGIRLITRSLTAELAGIVPTVADDLYVFPLVSFAYHW